MSRAAALLVLAVVAGCAQPPRTLPRDQIPLQGHGMLADRPPVVDRARGPVALQNPGFEEGVAATCAPRWACVAHADPASFRFRVVEGDAAEGNRSLCMERATPEPWAVAKQVIFDRGFRNTRVRLSLAMRTSGVDGGGAGPWLLVQGGDGTIAHKEAPVASTQGWERRSLEIDVPAGAEVLEFGLTALGSGRVCFDDVRLEVVGKSGP